MKPKIGVIIASIRQGRNGDTVKGWVSEQLATQDALGYSIIDLKERDIPRFTSAYVPAQQHYTDDFTREWSAEIAALDGFIVVTPEYNRNMPGVLKDAFDHLFHEWSFKPIAFIGYGTGGAYQAVEHLQLAAIEFGMVPIRRQIAVPIFDSVKNDAFTKTDQYDGELKALLHQLAWWANLLTPCREAQKETLKDVI